MKTFLGKGELGGTGWEKPGALTLQPEDFELLGLEALLGPAAGCPTDTSPPSGGWTLRARYGAGEADGGSTAPAEDLNPKARRKAGRHLGQMLGCAGGSLHHTREGQGPSLAHSGRQCARLPLQPLSRMP